MRRLLVLMALLPACREPAHISVKLEMACQDQMVQGTCSSMLLDCANYVEVRVYEVDGDHLGNILGSNCIPLSAFSPRPMTLCDLQQQKNALLDSLPEGKTVRFRLRALAVFDPQYGCNTDVEGQPPRQAVFDGFSAPLAIDGQSHVATIEISQCGS